MTNISPKRRKKSKKRGFPLFLAVSLEPMRSFFWHVFSIKVKPFGQIKLGRKWSNATDNQQYNYFEEIFLKIKPDLERGIRSLVLFSSEDDKISNLFVKHLKSHHHWLFNDKKQHSLQIISQDGQFDTIESIYEILESEIFQERIHKMLSAEMDGIIQILDETLASENGIVMITLSEIEKLLLPKKKFRKIWAEYFIVNENFLQNASSHQKSRLNRLFAIAGNKNVRVRIIPPETAASERLHAIGCMACFLEIDKRFEMI